jgi:hypothetical protein
MNPLDIIIAKPDEELPVEDVIFYAATKKGWLVNTPTIFGNAQVVMDPKEHPASLPEPNERFVLNGRKMPLHMLSQFHDLARKNFEKRKAECSAYLTWNPDTDDYKLFIPEQYVTHTSVNHKLDAGQIKHGYQAIGTIHSHCDFSAFHSGTDKHDMGKMPGLHITIGHVNTDDPDFDFAISQGDAAFTVTWEQIVDVERPLDKNGYATAPDHWLRFIKEGTAPWGYQGGVRTSYHKPYKHNGNYSPPKKYTPKQTPRQQKPPHQHWSDWGDWTDEDNKWYERTGTVQQHLFEGVNENEAAFEKYEDEVRQSEQTMESEAFFLALKGFVMNYNITFNPKRAEAYLNSQGVYYSIGDDQPLLPELSSGSTDAA